jgi:hypothetical protein
MKTLAVIVWFGLACAAGFALFNVTFKVEKLEAELGELNRQILADQQSIHILKAEWSYLDRPERLELLIGDYLPGLKSGGASPIVKIEQLPLRDDFGPYVPGAALKPTSLKATDAGSK